MRTNGRKSGARPTRPIGRNRRTLIGVAVPVLFGRASDHASPYAPRAFSELRSPTATRSQRLGAVALGVGFMLIRAASPSPAASPHAEPRRDLLGRRSCHR